MQTRISLFVSLTFLPWLAACEQEQPFVHSYHPDGIPTVRFVTAAFRTMPSDPDDPRGKLVCMGDISFEGDNFGNISHFGKLDFEPTQDNRGNTLRPCRFGTLQPVDPGELVYPEFEPVDLWVESPDEASMISLMVRFRGPERDVSSFQRLKGTIQFRHGGRQGDVEIPVSEIQHGLSWDHPTLAAAGVQVRFFAPEGEDTRGQFGVSVSGKLSNYGLGRVMVNGQEVRGCAEHHPPDADGNDISIFTARDGAFAAEAIYRVEVTTEPKDENILVVPFDLNDVPIEQWR